MKTKIKKLIWGFLAAIGILMIGSETDQIIHQILIVIIGTIIFFISMSALVIVEQKEKIKN